MTNAELIKALRKCGKQSPDRCWDCEYYDREPWCESALANDASDALEAAEQRIAELEKSYSWKAYAALEESIEGYKVRIAELEAQLPKEGEWVEANTRPRSAQFYCSVCHRTCYDIQPTRDKAWTKRCRYQFCPNCGARMDAGADGERRTDEQQTQGRGW